MEDACWTDQVERYLVRDFIILVRPIPRGSNVASTGPLLPLLAYILGIHYRHICVADTREPQSVELHRPVGGCERKKEGSAFFDTLHFQHSVDVPLLQPVLCRNQTIWYALRGWRGGLGIAHDSDDLDD